MDNQLEAFYSAVCAAFDPGLHVKYVRVAVPVPLFRHFDYLAPAPEISQIKPGLRVKVPFGQRQLIGVCVETTNTTQVPSNKIKPLTEVIDTTPIISSKLLQLANWASDYYVHPLGEVLQAMLPVLLRKPTRGQKEPEAFWQISTLGKNAEVAELKGAPVQAALLKHLQQADGPCGKQALQTYGSSWRQSLHKLAQKGLIEKTDPVTTPANIRTTDSAKKLNAEQGLAYQSIRDQLGAFARFLLDGVTGSGKTEVYLQLIQAIVQADKQALVLVPEIGLTPQLIKRIENRFTVKLSILHSGATDKERLEAWENARSGESRIILGTRSAIFTPMANPGLIIVDEEHDPSYKQQDGFRYHARDLAVMRAKLENIPVVLGSATPSFESLRNAERGQYQHLQLPNRAGAAAMPRLRLLDLRHQHLEEGLAEDLIKKIITHLEADNQVLLYLNRRGFAPILLCHECGWKAECPRCDARLTYHQSSQQLLCHHCLYQQRRPQQCPSCEARELVHAGIGTERLQNALQVQFPKTPIIRIDRDSTRNKGALEKQLQQIYKGEPCVLIGTQMLTKGHHFPKVTLVGIVDADSGLYSSDFRAMEILAQQTIQVAGRAGRADQAGEVIIQTHNPEHPLLQQLLRTDYRTFAIAALHEREATRFPPYARLALLRAESHVPEAALNFLASIRDTWNNQQFKHVSLLGPVPSLMEKIAGKYRAQLLFHSPHRKNLKMACTHLRLMLENTKTSHQVRWSLDIDPADLL